MNRRHNPDQGIVNLAILMHQPVALGHDGAPGNLRVRVLKRFGHAAGGFADDFHLALDGGAEEQIGVILGLGSAGYKALHGAGRGQHVQKSRRIRGGLVAFTRHRPPDSCS